MATKTFQTPELKLPEIVIGIVSPVGTNISPVISSMNKYFSEKKYDFHHIKISERFQAIAGASNYTLPLDLKRYDRINKYIDFGNHLRKEVGNEVLASLAISLISDRRLNRSGDSKFGGKVFVVDQLKSEAEISLLREVYGSCFFQISVYSARDVRVDYLSRVMAHEAKKSDRNPFRSKAEKLVVRDEDEQNVPHGQKVGKIFQLADVVLNADIHDEKHDIDHQVSRFIELLFGHNGFSPNRLEYGMYLAHSAALRSLDLSRQVGAAIFRSTGEIATLGANEVPKARGGTYWADDPYDVREFRVGQDSNDSRKKEILNEVVDILLGGKEPTSEQANRLDGSQFMDALEYGRIVHAEMSALSDAARLGISVANGTLYCTTFPCHMCSKLIVAAGLAKVIFLEPYPKSLTSDMHADSVKIEGTHRGEHEKLPSVDFLPFHGITPRRYRDFFQRGKRKVDGVFSPYPQGGPRPIVAHMAAWYGERETEIIKQLKISLTEFFTINAPTNAP